MLIANHMQIIRVDIDILWLYQNPQSFLSNVALCTSDSQYQLRHPG